MNNLTKLIKYHYRMLKLSLFLTVSPMILYIVLYNNESYSDLMHNNLIILLFIIMVLYGIQMYLWHYCQATIANLRTEGVLVSKDSDGNYIIIDEGENGYFKLVHNKYTYNIFKNYKNLLNYELIDKFSDDGIKLIHDHFTIEDYIED